MNEPRSRRKKRVYLTIGGDRELTFLTDKPIGDFIEHMQHVLESEIQAVSWDVILHEPGDE